jgi:hypothetical protein
MAPQRPYGCQCPRCGGDDFTEKFESTGGRFFTVTVDPSSAGCMAILFQVFSLFGIGFVVLGVVVVTQLAQTAGDESTMILYRILGCAAVIFGVLLTVCCIGWARSALNAGETPGTYKFECRLCYNAWTLKPGDSWPKVHMRPDLIAAGKERLEKERIRAVERRMQEERDKEANFNRIRKHHIHQEMMRRQKK